MKIRPRHHVPTARNWISVGLTVREAKALSESLRRSMLVDRGDPDGIDSFAHTALHQLEDALAHIENPPAASQ